MGTTAAIYLRVSLDRTGEELTVERHGVDCRRLAAERGWTVVAEYVDNSISASKRDVVRPAYDRMVEDYAAGRFDALVCWDLDRLTRQPRQLEDWIEAAEDRGLKLVTANGEADLATDGGRLFARIKASVARAEIERKAARQRNANAQRADMGKPPAGVRLTGYTIKGEVIEDEAAIIRAVFARFDTGDSLRGIAAWLTDQRVPTRRGGRWNPSTVRSILLNPRYAGRAVYCGEETGKPGTWEAIVSEGIFDSVQSRLSDPRRITNREGTDRKHLGSSLYLCGVCERAVYSHTGGRYRCPEGHITRIGSGIDEYVRAVIKARLAQPDVVAALGRRDDGTDDAARREVDRQRRRLAQVEADYDDDLIDARRYRVKREKILAEIKAAERARGIRVPTALAKLLEEANPAAAFDEAPLGTQRTIVDLLAVVKLHKAPRGRKFDPEDGTVEITPRRTS